MQKQKDKLQIKIHKLISQIEEENEKENKRYKDKDLEELGEYSNITSEKLDNLVKRIDAELREKQEQAEKENTADQEEQKKQNDKSKEKDRTKNKSKEKNEKKKEKEVKKETKRKMKALKTLKDDCLERLKKYEEQEKILNGRNSYSKTDNDAIFMRMKEDHMLNGQLKPGYNVQIGTNNQFILNYSIHQSAGDTVTLKENLEKFNKIYRKMPEKAIADAGYGSEENYEYLKEKNIESYVKYNYFHKEQKRSFKEQIYRAENMLYDKEKDEYICPNKKRLRYKETVKKKTDTGYIQTLKLYECENCTNCPNKNECTKSMYNRKIQINERLNELKKEEKEKLVSPEGKKLSGQRCIEPESVFGQIKWNKSFKRFLLRGLEKVNIEWGLIALAHNFCKLTSIFGAV